MNQNLPPHTLSTLRFTVRPALHARRAMTRIAERWWWVAALPLAFSLAMGTTDWRWLVVAMAMAFVALPLAAMSAWFSLLTRTDAIRDLYPHTVAILPEGTIRIDYFPCEPSDGLGDNTRCPEPFSIPLTGIITGSIEKRHITIVCKACRRDILIPLEAFHTQAEASDFYAAVARCN